MNTKSNLVLHCGASACDRSVLRALPMPVATETHHPQAHISLVEEVERALTASQMRIVNESFGITEGGERFFGLLQIESNQELQDYAYVLGLRGSINKSLSSGVAIGSSVFVCDNLSFSSEIVFHRKYTKQIERDFPLMVATAIGQLGKRYGDQTKRIDTYKRTAISLRDADHLLAEIADDVFPWAKFPNIRAEFIKPRHPEFVPETVWALFNAVTEFLKPVNANSKATALWTLPSRTGRLHKACDDYAGLTIDVPVEVMPVVAVPAVVPMVNEVLEPATSPFEQFMVT